MKYAKYSLILVVLVLAAVFIPRSMEVKFFVANLPSYFTTGQIVSNANYGSGKLDVYYLKDRDFSKPVIVFFHGGKWTNGRKENYRFVAEAFIRKHYVVVVPEVSQYPEGNYKIWQEDAAKAIAWTRANISKYQGDPEKIFILGHSSGGHIGALIATDEKYLAKQGGSRSWIKGYAGLASPYDFTPGTDELKAMFPDAGHDYADIRVTNFIDGKQPPMLMLWGRNDDAVGGNEMLLVEQAIKERGGQYEMKIYEEGEHISLVASFAPLSTSKEPVAEDVDGFF